MTTERECIEALREAAERLGESPTKAAYERLDLTPSAATILRVCGGWNAAKERAGLATNASTGRRTEPKPEDVDLSDGVEWPDMSQDQRWHYRNREWNTERTLRRRRRLREWVNDRKADSEGCTRCGESDPVVLDFHHPDPERKEMAVNEMVLYGYAREKIEDEIEQCELLCANCHFREHDTTERLDDLARTIRHESDGLVSEACLPDGSRTGFMRQDCLRAWTSAYKQARGCRRCGESAPVCLQFHHADGEKTGSVGTMISAGAPAQAVLSEVRTCVVLCANCHRREHHDEASPPDE